MNQENKAFLIIGGITIIVLAGILFLGGKKTQETAVEAEPIEVDSNTLVKEDSYKLSSDTATVTIVEFLDFQCEACRAAHPVFKKITEEYKGNVNFVIRYFPLSGHYNSKIAVKAAESAGEQGKFWEMHDILFEKQEEWGNEQKRLNTEQTVGFFVSYAETLGLDTVKFKESVQSTKFDEKINRDLAEATSLKINSTPTYFINGQRFNSVPKYEQLKKEIEDRLEPTN